MIDHNINQSYLDGFICVGVTGACGASLYGHGVTPIINAACLSLLQASYEQG